MQRTESSAVEARRETTPSPGLSEGLSRFLAWLLSAAAFIVAVGEAFAGFVALVASSSGLHVLLAFALFFIAYVQFFLSNYLAAHRRELVDLFCGEGSLASGRDIAIDFFRYLAINLALHSSYALIPAGFIAGFAIAEIGSGGGALVAIAALVTPIVCWHYSGRMSTYLSHVLERFSNWDGMAYGVPSQNSGFAGLLAAGFERMVFPPLQLVAPSYIQILPEGKAVDALPPGAEIETTHLVQISSEPSDEATEARCQVCGTSIDGAHVRCTRCDTPHHVDCWEFNEGCSTYGCGNNEYRKANEP